MVAKALKCGILERAGHCRRCSEVVGLDAVPVVGEFDEAHDDFGHFAYALVASAWCAFCRDTRERPADGRLATAKGCRAAVEDLRDWSQACIVEGGECRDDFDLVENNVRRFADGVEPDGADALRSDLIDAQIRIFDALGWNR